MSNRIVIQLAQADTLGLLLQSLLSEDGISGVMSMGYEPVRLDTRPEKGKWLGEIELKQTGGNWEFHYSSFVGGGPETSQSNREYVTHAICVFKSSQWELFWRGESTSDNGRLDAFCIMKRCS